MYAQANSFNLPIRSSSVDLVIADPPFGIGFTGKPSNYNRNADLVEKYLEITKDYNNFVLASMSEIRRILKPTGTAWIVMGYTNLQYWEHWGNYFFKNQIGHVVWKYQFGVYAKKRPVVSHYHLLVYTAGDKWTWNQQGYDEDVWIINRPYIKGVKKYPNKLPYKVIEEMIIRSSNRGDVVYDPFVGSGSTVEVANSLGRIGLGSDLLNNSEFWYLTKQKVVV